VCNKIKKDQEREINLSSEHANGHSSYIRGLAVKDDGIMVLKYVLFLHYLSGKLVLFFFYKL